MGVTCSSDSHGRLPSSPELPGGNVSGSHSSYASSQTRDSAEGAGTASTGGIKTTIQHGNLPREHGEDLQKESVCDEPESSADDNFTEDADITMKKRDETKEPTDTRPFKSTGVESTALCFDDKLIEHSASDVTPVEAEPQATSDDGSDRKTKMQKDDSDPLSFGQRQKSKFLLTGSDPVEREKMSVTPWDLNKFKEDFKVEIIRMEDRELEFDMINICAPLANTFRRILMSEVPSMAIDEVCIYNNTSLIADEVLAHRLGLVPIKADPRLFEYYNSGGEKTAQDSIEFQLKIKCTTNPNAGDSQDPDEMYINRKVYTRHLKWVPMGDQEIMYKEGDLRPVDDDILLAIMKPGQEIDLVAYCHKGMGKDHAKFSPVCTAHYRMMPTITLTKPVTGESAHRLQKLFSKGVIEVHDVDGVPTAMVAHPRRDRGSRNFLTDLEFKDCVKVDHISDHFIFSIESVGNLPPDLLMLEAVKVMIQKCDRFIRGLEQLQK